MLDALQFLKAGWTISIWNPLLDERRLKRSVPESSTGVIWKSPGVAEERGGDAQSTIRYFGGQLLSVGLAAHSVRSLLAIVIVVMAIHRTKVGDRSCWRPGRTALSRVGVGWLYFMAKIDGLTAQEKIVNRHLCLPWFCSGYYGYPGIGLYADEWRLELECCARCEIVLEFQGNMQKII